MVIQLAAGALGEEVGRRFDSALVAVAEFELDEAYERGEVVLASPFDALEKWYTLSPDLFLVPPAAFQKKTIILTFE